MKAWTAAQALSERWRRRSHGSSSAPDVCRVAPLPPEPCSAPREEVGVCGLIFILPVAAVMSSPLCPPPQVMGHPCSGQDQIRLLHCSTHDPG